MDGPTAAACGLVHRVYPAGADLRRAAKPFINELSTLDLWAYAQTKARILASVDLDFEPALAFTP